MCGIHASISAQSPQSPSEAVKQLLCRRGPDHLGEANSQVVNHNGQTCQTSLLSTVLAMRGGHLVPQPFVDPLTGSSLCWNGEAWKIGMETVIDNDGRAVFDALLKASSSQSNSPKSDHVLEVLRSIAGPFAFLFLDKVNKSVYFGRDRLGRRSLLFRKDTSGAVLKLSSMADPSSGEWKEIEVETFYQLSYDEQSSLKSNGVELPELSADSIGAVHRHAWTSDSGISPLSLGTFNMSIPEQNFELNLRSHSVSQLNSYLSESLKLRITNVPLPPAHEEDNGDEVRIAILFSGGLDCTVLARMAHDILPSTQYIDLINVAFENPRVVQAAKNSVSSKKGSTKQASNEEMSDSHVASAYERCPDRETGRKAFLELQQICPGRSWRFIAVDIPYTETVAHRADVVQLIHPHNTEMDLSIAYALYFAARGSGLATSSTNPTPVPYTTPARVLLSGLGADELFGGYTRHATAFSRNGFPALLDELKLDVDRLGKRNLGRDDRVISHWGREARFPYLDEELVKWAVECPIWMKCGFEAASEEQEKQVPEIEPGKKVLRLLAWKLGMHSVAVEKKRAIQFGARTAKMEVGRTKGTNLIS